MKRIKNPGSDLERKRAALFFLGLLLASALVLVAFEWKTFYTQTHFTEVYDGKYLDDEVILHAFPPSKVIPPPPPAPKPIVDIFVTVENDRLLTEVLDVPDIDMDEAPIEIDFRKEDVDEHKVWARAEEDPEFPGGWDALYAYLSSNLNYPRQAAEAGIGGKVFVYFVIGKDGEIRDVKLMNSIGGGCDEEALRVIKAMPAWKPGKQRGKAVNVSFHLPVYFNLK